MAALALLALSGGAACQPVTPTEPAMAITAKADAYPIAATTSHVAGKVTPAKATKKVYLQRTVGGQWVDWQACPAGGCDGAPRVPAANVNQSTGAYSIDYPVQWCGQVLHLRVRSAGSTKTSPGFYTQADIHESC